MHDRLIKTLNEHEKVWNQNVVPNLVEEILIFRAGHLAIGDAARCYSLFNGVMSIGNRSITLVNNI